MARSLPTERDCEQRIAELEAINKDLLAIADNTALIMAGHDIAQLKERIANLETQLTIETLGRQEARENYRVTYGRLFEIREAARRVCQSYAVGGINLSQAIEELDRLVSRPFINQSQGGTNQ